RRLLARLDVGQVEAHDLHAACCHRFRVGDERRRLERPAGAVREREERIALLAVPSGRHRAAAPIERLRLLHVCATATSWMTGVASVVIRRTSHATAIEQVAATAPEKNGAEAPRRA